MRLGTVCSDYTTPDSFLAPKYCRSEALGNQITELCGPPIDTGNAATYRLLEMIRQFDQEGLWQLEGVCSCAHCIQW